ncbi:MAG: GNAT family N-acetyltransferase [Candidatus Thermoplasmatota archaeon]|nr:GNAT family N-acetyltransferase [Candidatus Thermoplasmatota archaeon]
MHVRKARSDDLEDLLKLWNAFMEDQRELGRKDGKDRLQRMKDNAPEIAHGFFLNTIRSPNGLLLVIEDDEKTKGYMLSRINKNIPVFENDLVGYVSDIYLEPELRGKGAASRLWEQTLDWFEKKEVKEISLKVLRYNTGAFDVYEHWGFQHVLSEMRLDL